MNGLGWKPVLSRQQQKSPAAVSGDRARFSYDDLSALFIYK
jgi:hypothetical protein